MQAPFVTSAREPLDDTAILLHRFPNIHTRRGDNDQVCVLDVQERNFRFDFYGYVVGSPVPIQRGEAHAKIRRASFTHDHVVEGTGASEDLEWRDGGRGQPTSEQDHRDVEVGNKTVDELCAAAAHSNAVLAELGSGIHWLESFVTQDKIFCVYVAQDEAKVREHAKKSGFPASAVREVRSMLDPSSAVT